MHINDFNCDMYEFEYLTLLENNHTRINTVMKYYQLNNN